MNVNNLVEEQDKDLEISSDLTSVTNHNQDIIIKEKEENNIINKFSNLVIKNIQYNNSNDNDSLVEEDERVINKDSDDEEINEFTFLLKGKETLNKLEELAEDFSELDEIPLPKKSDYDKLEEIFEKQIINKKDVDKYKKEDIEEIKYILKSSKDIEIILKRICKSLDKQILKFCVKGWSSYHNVYNINESKIIDIISKNDINNKYYRIEIGIMYKQDNGWYNTFTDNKYNVIEMKILGEEREFIKKCIKPLINLEDGYKLRKNINSYNCRCEKKECVINNKKNTLIYYVKLKKNK